MATYKIPPDIAARLDAAVCDAMEARGITEEEAWSELESLIGRELNEQIRRLIEKDAAEEERRILYGTGGEAPPREYIWWRGPSQQQIEDCAGIELPGLRDELA